MSDYTKLNLREVENAAPRFGFPQEMEARFATRPLELAQCGVGLLRCSQRRGSGAGRRDRARLVGVISR